MKATAVIVCDPFAHVPVMFGDHGNATDGPGTVATRVPST